MLVQEQDMQKWTVGDVTITRVVELEAVHALVVDAPGLKLVVDTCFGNDEPRRLTARTGLQTAFVEWLVAAGCKPEAVTAVVCTHLHVDHVGWNRSTSFDSDRDAACATGAQLLGTLADERVLVIGTHFATPTAGHVVRDATGYQFVTFAV